MTDNKLLSYEIARCVRGCATDEQFMELVGRIDGLIERHNAEIERLKSERESYRRTANELARRTAAAESALAAALGKTIAAAIDAARAGKTTQIITPDVTITVEPTPKGQRGLEMSDWQIDDAPPT